MSSPGSRRLEGRIGGEEAWNSAADNVITLSIQVSCYPGRIWWHSVMVCGSYNLDIIFVIQFW